MSPTINKELNDFIEYFNSFYGPGGIHETEFEFNESDILKAIANFAFRKPIHHFEGDSFDRELIKAELMFLKGLITEDNKYYQNPISTIFE